MRNRERMRIVKKNKAIKLLRNKPDATTI
jgi:hypothetical protein